MVEASKLPIPGEETDESGLTDSGTPTSTRREIRLPGSVI